MKRLALEEKEKEKERERERERERLRDRQTDRQTDRDTQRQRDWELNAERQKTTYSEWVENEILIM